MPSILHKNIPDSSIHEPKGISTAVVDSMAKANGVGSTTWNASFISADQPLAIKVEVSHGLGATPKQYSCYLKNVVSQGGYSPGDLIPIRSTGYFTGVVYPTVYADSTKIGVLFIPSAIVKYPTKQFIGVYGFIFLTSTNWKLIFKGEL